MASQTVNVAVLAETSKFAKGMSDASKSASGFGSKFSKVGLAIGVAVGATVAGIAEIGIESAKSLARIETLNAQTGAAIKSTGGAAGQTLGHIQKVSGELERLTSVEAESIQEGQNLLLTFTNIKGPVFDEATKSATDMAVALGTDVKSQALSLGKALNDPIAGVTKLSRVGVTFTDEQKSQIENYSKMGDLASAQGVILTEVNKEFGGSAEAYGGTISGLKDKVLNEWGTVGETLTAAFMPAASGVLQFVNDFLVKINDSKGFAAFASGFSNAVSSVFDGKAFAPLVAFFATLAPIFAQAFGPILPVIGQLGSAFLSLAPQVSPFGIVLQALAPIIPQLVSAFGQLASGALTTLVGVFTTLAPVIGQVSSTLVTLLSGVFVALLPVVVQLIDTLSSALTQLAPVFTTLVGAILPVVATLISSLMPVILNLITTLLPPLASLFTSVVSAIVPLVAQIVSALMPAFQAILPVITPVISILSAVLIPVIQALLPVISAVFGAIVPIIQAAMQIIQGVIQVVTGIISGNWSQVWAGIKNIVAGVWNGIRAVISGALSVISAVVSAGLGIVRGIFSSIWGAVKGVVKGAVDGIVGSARSMASGIGDGVSSAIGFIDGIQGKVVSALSGAGQWLVDTGSHVISGFVNGISNSMGAIGDIAARIGNKLMDGVKGLLGIHSPSREMAKLGKFSVQGFAKGLSDLAPVKRAMRTMTGLVMTPVTPTAFVDGGSLMSPTTNVIQVSMLHPTRESGRVIAESLDEYQRVNGRR